MSSISFIVAQAAERTGGDPKIVRELLDRGIRNLPEGAPVDRATMGRALDATRAELTDPEQIRIIEQIQDEFRSMGMFKQILVFSAIGAGIEDARRELRS